MRSLAKPVVALGGVLLVASACGEIAGLRDPEDITTDAGTIPTDDGPGDDVVITPEELDLGASACGETSTSTKTVEITNRGSTSPHYKVQIAEGSAFVMGGALEGDLATGASTTITVAAKPESAGDNATEIAVTAGSAVAQIPVKAIGEGAHLELSPSIANLGAVRRENGGSIDVTVANTGNEAVTITKIDSSLADFSATWPGAPAPLAIDPGATKVVTVKLASGADSAVLDGNLTFTLDGVHCGAVPTLPVQGQRVNQDVTISPADFGVQYCTRAPTLQRDIVISNYTASTLAYDAVLRNGANSAFTIVSGAAGNIGAGSTATPTTTAVKLAMKAVGTTVAPISEIVDIEISGIAAPSGGPRTATASADIHGIVLKITPSNSTGFRRGEQRNFTIANSGNEPCQIQSAFVRDANTTQKPAWAASWPSQSIGGGQSRGAAISFIPGYYDRGYYAGTYTLSSSNGIPVCNTPATLHLQGSY